MQRPVMQSRCAAPASTSYPLIVAQRALAPQHLTSQRPSAAQSQRTPPPAPSMLRNTACQALPHRDPLTVWQRQRHGRPCTALRAAPDPKRPVNAVQWGRGTTSSTSSTTSSTLSKQQRGSRGSQGDPEGDGPEDEGWQLLSLSKLNYSWPVPWGAGTVAGGMVLWLASFVVTGFVVVPSLYKQAGIDIYELNAQGRATFALVSQLAETVVSLALIRVLTVQAMREAPLQEQATLFNYSPSKPLSKPEGWAVWALVGVIISPFLVASVAALMSVTGYEENVGGPGTVDGVASMITMDLPTYLSLLSVTGVLAPLLEETVFRGFLLTSLTKFMPTWAAIPSSAFLFGAAHLSPKDFPVLFALGCLLGALYVRSRNLLTPMLVHGAWNSTVLTLLFLLVSSGIDIQELLGQLDK